MGTPGLEVTEPKRWEEHNRQREQWEQRLTVKPQMFADREGIERYKNDQSLRIYEKMSELFQSRSNLEIILYSRANTGYESKERPKQDYSTVLRSERQKSSTTERTQSQPNEELAAGILQSLSTGET